jgi:hypothetical protein
MALTLKAEAHINNINNPVRASERTPHLSVTNVNCLMLFKEVIAVYSENDTKQINIKCSATDC